MHILFSFCDRESSTVREVLYANEEKRTGRKRGEGEEKRKRGRERKREREGGRVVLCTYGDVLLSIAVPVDDLQQTLHHSTGHQSFYTYNDCILQCDSHSTSTHVLHQHTKAPNTHHTVYSIKKDDSSRSSPNQTVHRKRKVHNTYCSHNSQDNTGQ